MSAPAAVVRVPQLDGLRGLAILQVLLWHVSVGLEGGPKGLATAVRIALSYTWSGVDLFFVLSGFLVGGILIDQRDRARYFSTFYIRRFFRIVPLYVVFVALGFALHAVYPAATAALGEPIAWIWYGLFLQNVWMAGTGAWTLWLAVSWSLAVEEQFYILQPLFVRLTPRRVFAIAVLALIPGALLLRLVAFAVFGKPAATAVYVLLPFRMDALLLGVACAIAMRDAHWRAAIVRSRRWMEASLAAIVLILAAGAALRLNQQAGFLMSSYGFTLLAVGYAMALLLALTAEGSPVMRFFRAGWLRRLGLWAYFLYLAHPVVIFFAFDAFGVRAATNWMPALTTPGRWAILAGGVALLLALAHLSWRFFEKPLIDVSHRWTFGETRAPATPAVARAAE